MKNEDLETSAKNAGELPLKTAFKQATQDVAMASDGTVTMMAATPLGAKDIKTKAELLSILELAMAPCEQILGDIARPDGATTLTGVSALYPSVFYLLDIYDSMVVQSTEAGATDAYIAQIEKIATAANAASKALRTSCRISLKALCQSIDQAHTALMGSKINAYYNGNDGTVGGADARILKATVLNANFVKLWQRSMKEEMGQLMCSITKGATNTWGTSGNALQTWPNIDAYSSVAGCKEFYLEARAYTAANPGLNTGLLTITENTDCYVKAYTKAGIGDINNPTETNIYFRLTGDNKLTSVLNAQMGRPTSVTTATRQAVIGIKPTAPITVTSTVGVSTSGWTQNDTLQIWLKPY